MAVTLLASACPAIPVPVVSPTIASAETDQASGGLGVWKRIAARETPWTPKHNRNQAASEYLARIGGGAYGVVSGMELVAPVSGLSLTVNPGMVNCDGPMEKTSAVTLAITNSSGRYWIYLKQVDGSVVASSVNSLSHPVGLNVVLLGSCVVSSPNITSVDTSGVVYLKGRDIIRYTADIGPPTDTPGATVPLHLVRTLDGWYWWDGSAYIGQSLAFAKGLTTLPSTDYAYVPANTFQGLISPYTNNGKFVNNGRLVNQQL